MKIETALMITARWVYKNMYSSTIRVSDKLYLDAKQHIYIGSNLFDHIITIILPFLFPTIFFIFLLLLFNFIFYP